MYSRATPGVNAPNVAGVPSVSDSVAGTEPPTVPCSPIWTRCVCTADWLPLMSVANHLISVTPGSVTVSTSPRPRGRSAL